MSKLDNIVKQLTAAGFQAHRTTSEVNVKVAGRSVYITGSKDGLTCRLSLMGKGQHTLAMPIVNATGGVAPHVTQYMNSWTVGAGAMLKVLKTAEKAATAHRAKYLGAAA